MFGRFVRGMDERTSRHSAQRTTNVSSVQRTLDRGRRSLAFPKHAIANSILLVSSILSLPLGTLNATPFVRGDVNMNGLVDIGDGIAVLSYLFAGESLVCLDAADANDNGSVDMEDPTFIFAYLFASQTAPPAPYPVCGCDPTLDQLGCTGPTFCPRGLSPRIQISPDAGRVPLTVTCDGSTSQDVRGQITSYEWDLGDGETAVGASILHTYSRPGTYVVQLTIRNDRGLTATDCQTVSVWDTSPHVQSLTWTNHADHVALAWEVTAPCDQISVSRGNQRIARLPGDARTYTVPEENPGVFRYTVAVHADGRLQDQKDVIADRGTLVWDPVLSTPVSGYYVYAAPASEPFPTTRDARLDVPGHTKVPLKILHAQGLLPRTGEYRCAARSYRGELVSNLSAALHITYEVVLESP